MLQAEGINPYELAGSVEFTGHYEDNSKMLHVMTTPLIEVSRVKVDPRGLLDYASSEYKEGLDKEVYSLLKKNSFRQVQIKFPVDGTQYQQYMNFRSKGHFLIAIHGYNRLFHSFKNRVEHYVAGISNPPSGVPFPYVPIPISEIKEGKFTEKARERGRPRKNPIGVFTDSKNQKLERDLKLGSRPEFELVEF